MIMLQGKAIWDLSRIPGQPRTRLELTDLVRFQDHWYCGFHEGVIHSNHPAGRGRVIRSRGGESWETAALLEWDGADMREPKLSVTAEGWLMVNTSICYVTREAREEGTYYLLDRPGTPESDREPEAARQSLTWLSADGATWSSAHACPSGINTWRWEVSWHNGMGYSIGYAGKDKAGTLYRTRDGKTWRVLKPDFFPGGHGNEGSLAFAADNTAYCLLRDGFPRARSDIRGSDGHEIAAGQGRQVHGTSLPMLGIGKGPYYQEWEWKRLRVDWSGNGDDRPVEEVFRAPLGGPKLLYLSDGRLMAAGRTLGPGMDDGRITLFEVDPARARLTRRAQCDGTTYAGMAEYNGELWFTFADSRVSSIQLARMPVPR